MLSKKENIGRGNSEEHQNTTINKVTNLVNNFFIHNKIVYLIIKMFICEYKYKKFEQ